jgi:polar amino acid transport system substrate-binding protein
MKDLKDKPVATIEDTYAAEVIDDENIGSISYKMKTLSEAIELLKSNKVAAVVYDAPPLQRYASKNDGFIVPDITVRTQSYGFALPKNSSLRGIINQTILELQEDGEYQHLYNKWLD